jgi:aspartate ammonia-lyase
MFFVKMRKEKDFIGELELSEDSLTGIHTLRAVHNFPLAGRPVRKELFRAYATVKRACLLCNRELGFFPDEEIFSAVQRACLEVEEGLFDEYILVDALQGGAGTSTNMNLNELIANRALQLAGKKPGDYDFISPLGHINLHQSTNDTYPTALKLAAIQSLHQLEDKVIILQEAFQEKEKELAHAVKTGRTQLRDAVPITLGREMSAYADAFGRDRWRIYKCEERLRVVNLGGGAVGTGMTVPRKYIFRVVDILRELTGIGFARAENMVENTQNLDVFVEVSAIIKACAVSLMKAANDLRLLGSGPRSGFAELELPPRQAGSSIMPGKMNPVIPEAAVQTAMLVMGNDTVITQAAASGCLELNPFLPLVAECLLQNIAILGSACEMLAVECVRGLKANEDRCAEFVNCPTAVATALISAIGYKKAAELAEESENSGRSIRELVLSAGLMSDGDFEALISPEAICRLGYV